MQNHIERRWITTWICNLFCIVFLFSTSSQCMENNNFGNISSQLSVTNFDSVPDGLKPLTKDILFLVCDYLEPIYRAQFFSTNHQLNTYALTIYYPQLCPTLNKSWYRLSFKTDEDSRRFNLLLMKCIEKFQSLCERLYIDQNSPNENIRIEKDSALIALSEYLINITEQAHILHNIKNPPGYFMSIFGFDWFETMGRQPLIPLFKWVIEYAQGNVVFKPNPIDQSRYYMELGKHVIHTSIPHFHMEGRALPILCEYIKIIEYLLNNPILSNLSSSEIKLHKAIFNHWYNLFMTKDETSESESESDDKYIVSYNPLDKDDGYRYKIYYIEPWTLQTHKDLRMRWNTPIPLYIPKGP